MASDCKDGFDKAAFSEVFGVPQCAWPVIDCIVSPLEQAVCVRLGLEAFTALDVARVIEEAHLSIPNVASFTVAAYRRGIFALDGEPSPSTAGRYYRLSNFYGRLDIFVVTETET